MGKSLFVALILNAYSYSENPPPAPPPDFFQVGEKAEVTLVQPDSSPTVNWTQWRGPSGAGVSFGFALPQTWVTGDKVNFRWRQELEGEGHSSPIVFGNTVILTSTRKDDEGSDYLMVHALDKETGKTKWANSVDWVSGPLHFENSFAAATPATDGKRVYVFTGNENAVLVAYRLTDGVEQWRTPIGNLSHEFGTSASPIVFENTVIQLCDSEFNSSLKAFDAESGKLLWSTNRKSTGSWATPVVVGVISKGKKQNQIVVNGGGVHREAVGAVTAYDLETGKPVWTFPGTTEYVCPSIIVGKKHLFSGSGRFSGPLYALTPKFNRESETEATDCPWFLRSAGAYIPTGIAYEGLLYMVSDYGVLQAFDPEATSDKTTESNKRGPEMTLKKRAYQYRLADDTRVSASLIAGDGKVYVFDQAGRVFVIRAGKNHEVLATNVMPEPIHATPAVSEGSFYLRTTKAIYRID